MLKKTLLFLALFAATLFASSEMPVNSKLEKVKVFLSGAELTHEAEINLNKGTYDLVFTDLASGIVQNSVQVSASGSAVILSVVKRFNYLQSLQKNPQIISLEDSLKNLNYLLSQSKNEKETAEAELDLILSNKVLSGTDKPVSVADLQKMADFFKKRISGIKNSILNYDLKIKDTQKSIDRIKKQLDELNNQLNQPVNEVVVTVSTESKTNLMLTLTYLVNNAGWEPAYDVRVKDIYSKPSLTYKANVWQNTGIDWNDLKITLSTRNPFQRGTKPELRPWFINFEQRYRSMDAMKKEMPNAMAISGAQEAEAKSLADYIDVNFTQLSVEFTSTINYTIPADSKQHAVSLNNYELDADYKYYAIPKYDSDAFLVANMTKWNELNLLPGQANIYFENSYVGKSFINPNTTSDTLAISLGRDKNINVTRVLLKDFTEDKFLSSDIERTFGYNLIVKNNKRAKIELILQDQIPISQNEDIEVNLIDKSGAVLNKENGLLQWNLEVDPGSSVTKKLVYSVRYPKDKNIPNL